MAERVEVTRAIIVKLPMEGELVILTKDDGEFLGAKYRWPARRGESVKEEIIKTCVPSREGKFKMTERGLDYVSPGTVIVEHHSPYCTRYYDPITKKVIYICTPPGTKC